MSKNRIITILLIINQAILIAFTNIASKQAAMEVDPFVISFFRYVIGVSAMGLIVLIKGSKIKIDWADWKQLIFLMFCGMVFNQLLFAQALAFTVPSHPPLIYALTPIVIILIDIIRHKRVASKQIILASLLSLIGVGIVMGKNILIFNSSILLGDTLVFLAMICWSFYTAFGKKMIHKYGALELLLILLTGAMILYMPWGIHRTLQADLSMITSKGWLSIVYLGVFSSGMAYLNYFLVLKRIDPAQTGLIITLHPPATMFLSILFGFEHFQWHLVAGTILVILALWISQRTENSKQ